MILREERVARVEETGVWVEAGGRNASAHPFWYSLMFRFPSR